MLILEGYDYIEAFSLVKNSTLIFYIKSSKNYIIVNKEFNF